MKSLTLILSLLLITYSLQAEIALTACEVTNDATTKTTAVITCSANATLAEHTFKDDYLKIQGSASADANATKTATLATCTNSCTGTGTLTCTITCTKVTGAEAGGWYILSPIQTAATSNVFTNSGKTGDGITLANLDSSTKKYEGQAAASGNNNTNTNNTNTNNNNNNDTSDGNSLKYYLVSLLSLLLF
jgi:hypothetical protein